MFQTLFRCVVLHPLGALLEFRLPHRMSQHIRSVSGAKHPLDIHIVGMYGPLDLELLGTQVFRIPSTCAEKHALACVCIHTQSHIPIFCEELVGRVVHQNGLKYAFHCNV